jgi:DNA-directed RNA polymerase specialized sigma24 family protein
MSDEVSMARRRAARGARASRVMRYAGGRARVEAVLARRGARERLVLTLLLYERLFPIEVADTLGLSVRQVERTYDAMLLDLRRSLSRGTSRVRTTASATRQRRAA